MDIFKVILGWELAGMDLVVLCKRDTGMQGPRISFWPAAGARKLALVSTVLNSLVRPEK